MSNIIIDIAAQFTGKKAFSDADRAAARVNKSVKNLAATFGVAFSAQAFVNYSKNAVKAFAEDDKAARTLTKTLDNLGLAFADADIKTFIADLEKQFGVLDDELRPAYQKLITATGDWRKSQQLLRLSLDLSAQSGEAVTTTANDLSQALVGNTKGLKKYNLGLTNAQLAALSFEEVLVRLTKISQGQAALAADTYSGKLNKLKVAAANAQEVLGGALLDSFIKLSGGDVDKAVSKIDTFSTRVAKLTRLLTGADSLSEALNSVDYRFGFIPTDRKVSTNRSKSPAGTYKRNQAEIAAAAAAKKLAEDQAKSQKALTKAQQDALKLAKAKAVFELQKIQIEAALKGKLSEEDRIRLKLLQAIEKENISDIEKYQEKLKEAQDKAKDLQAALDKVKGVEVKDPFSTWKVDPLANAINGLAGAIVEVRTGMTSTGVAYSTLAKEIADTVIKPNLTQWSSSFKVASDEFESAQETAVSSLTSTGAAATAAAIAATAALTASNNESLASMTAAATKAAIEASAAATTAANAALTSTSATTTEAIGATTTSATNTTALAIAETGSATANTILETSQSAADALDKLYEDSNTALSNATSATVTDFMATSSAALASLREILAAEAADYAAAAAAASAQAAADAADLAGAGNAGANNNVNITVNTGVGDPNAIAEAIQQVLIDAGNRGTLDLQGIG